MLAFRGGATTNLGGVREQLFFLRSNFYNKQLKYEWNVDILLITKLNELYLLIYSIYKDVYDW